MQHVQDKLPRGPRLSPATQLARFMADPRSFLEMCDREHGDYFTIRLLGQPPLVCTSDPEALKWIFTRTEDELSHANDILRVAFGDRSVLFMDGAQHKRERRMLTPMFHGRRIRAYGETMLESAREIIATWPRGEPFEIHPRIQDLAFQIIAKCVFGAIDSTRLSRLCDLLRIWLDESFSPFLCVLTSILPPEHVHARTLTRTDTHSSVGWMQKIREKVIPWALANRRAKLNASLSDEIAYSRRTGEAGRDDLLAMLCDARDEHGEPMSDSDIRDEVLTLLVSGHESTTVTLTWAIYHILRNPGVGRRIKDEVRRAFSGGPVVLDRVGELSYVDAVINESMRLTPIALGVPRKLNRASRVGRYDLPEGTILINSAHLTHRRPDLWENPTAFHPERFLDRKPDPFTFFPFGGGPRRCVGVEFARHEMRIILAHLFSCTSIAEVPGLKIRPHFRGVHFSPPRDMSIVLDARRDAVRDATAAACA